MLNRNRIFAELAQVLATTYRSQANAERIALDAGLDLTRVAAHPTPIDHWRDIVNKAYLQGCLDQLVDLACKEYSMSRPLLEARHSYIEWAKTDRLGEQSTNHYDSGQSPVNRHQVSYESLMGIDESSPLLIGVLVDVSQSMMNALEKSPRKSELSRKHLLQLINTIIERAILYCRTPESEDVLPRVKVFAYGYGFGAFRYRVNDIFTRIGITQRGTETVTIPVSSVRDMFAEIAEKEGLAVTPSARDLYEHLDSYRKSVEAQLVDAGLGQSVLKESLQLVHDRFRQELVMPHYPHSILLIISDGKITTGNENEIRQITTSLRQMGVQIVSCFVGEKNVTHPKSFYEIPDNEWPNEAILLFDCASIVSNSNKITDAAASMAKEHGWIVPHDAKLFVQVNQSKMLEEFVQIILSALKD